MSRPTLWTDLDCVDLAKTRVHLERSKSSPLNLTLNSDYADLSDTFEFISGAVGRLKYLDIGVASEELQRISVHLSSQAPLLEVLSVRGYYHESLLSPALFNGDLSSLRELHLRHVSTQLPCRNVTNLTSITLGHKSVPVSISRLLEFFEGAPHLREVEIYSTTPISDDWDGRLVQLTYLQRMDADIRPSSLLFDHLLIPAGARLTMGVNLPSPPTEGHPPRFIDNLKNLSNSTTIKLARRSAGMEFSGPNGEVSMVPQVNDTWFMLESLAHFDTSKTELLEITRGISPTSDPLYRALLPMKDLRTLKLYGFKDPQIFVRALHPSMSPSGVVVCPRLEELVIEYMETFDIKQWRRGRREGRNSRPLGLLPATRLCFTGRSVGARETRLGREIRL